MSIALEKWGNCLFRVFTDKLVQFAQANQGGNFPPKLGFSKEETSFQWKIPERGKCRLQKSFIMKQWKFSTFSLFETVNKHFHITYTSIKTIVKILNNTNVLRIRAWFWRSSKTNQSGSWYRFASNIKPMIVHK